MEHGTKQTELMEQDKGSCSSEDDRTPLKDGPPPARYSGVGLFLLGVAILTMTIMSFTVMSPPPASSLTITGRHYDSNGTEIYLGNGCFWERQWAYYSIESTEFGRPNDNITSQVGYAGGSAPQGDTVCHHSGDGRDYSRLGHAEVVRVQLDTSLQAEQFSTLAADFFNSFTGPAGTRSRPDPMDRGRPYRSVVGLPGGRSSPLYSLLVAANTFGMKLEDGAGGDPDTFNTIWVYDSRRFPFFAGEVYHQFHSNFFHSDGMPYPSAYLVALWRRQQELRLIRPTDCPGGQHW